MTATADRPTYARGIVVVLYRTKAVACYRGGVVTLYRGKVVTWWRVSVVKCYHGKVASAGDPRARVRVRAREAGKLARSWREARKLGRARKLESWLAVAS